MDKDRGRGGGVFRSTVSLPTVGGGWGKEAMFSMPCAMRSLEMENETGLLAFFWFWGVCCLLFIKSLRFLVSGGMFI